jgi:hypothetical protein
MKRTLSCFMLMICLGISFFVFSQPNPPPVTVNEYITIAEDTPAIGNVLNNGDTDPDGTALTVNTTPAKPPAHGTIIVNPNGDFIYTPSPNFNGWDLIVLIVCDNGIPLPPACSHDTLLITITPVSDPPITVNEYISVNPNTPYSGNILTNGDTDPDGTALTVSTTPVVPPSQGTITLNSNGSFTYTPNPSFTGNDLVVASVCDNGIPLPPACSNDTIFFHVGPTVHIYYAVASPSTQCLVPQMVNFYIHGYVSGYLPIDSIHIYMNFGDGTDTSFYKSAAPMQIQANIIHLYNFPGIYSQIYILTDLMVRLIL